MPSPSRQQRLTDAEQRARDKMETQREHRACTPSPTG
jgi:hypothetical protein